MGAGESGDRLGDRGSSAGIYPRRRGEKRRERRPRGAGMATGERGAVSGTEAEARGSILVDGGGNVHVNPVDYRLRLETGVSERRGRTLKQRKANGMGGGRNRSI